MTGLGPRSLALIACMIAGCGDAERSSPLPQVDDRGGPVMAHPALVPIFFADDPDIDALTAFSQWIVTSQWLAAVGAEYRVGSGSVLGVVRLAAPAPSAISDGGILDLVFAGLADGTIPRPAGGDLAGALYMVHFPAHTVVTDRGATSCIDFGGYHASARRGGIELAYAVLPSCPGFIAGEPDLAIRELVSSHELIEAATDPYPVNHPGFLLNDPISAWQALGGEVADLCARGDASATWSEAGFVAQRSWSNAAAAAGGDPCVPGPQTPYFTVAAAQHSVRRIAPGKSRSIDLTGYASGARDDFVWQIGSAPSGNDEVALTLSRDTLSAGQNVTLIAEVLDDAVPGSVLRFFVTSKGPSGYQQLPLFAAVGNDCTIYAGCEACAALIGCGFCTATGKCESQGEAGSADSACPASSFATWPGSCPGFCAAHATCADCSSQPGCGWCGGAAPHCVEADHATAQPRDASCDYADWSFSPSYCPL